MKNIIYILLFVAGTMFARAQTSTWYKSDYEIRDRLTLSKDNIVSEQLVSEKEQQNPRWKLDRTTQIQKSIASDTMKLMLLDAENDKKMGAVFTFYGNNTILGIYLHQTPIKSLSELEKKTFLKLPQRLYISEILKNSLSHLKGLQELTKKDLIAAVNFVRSHSSVFETFLQANTNTSPYAISRIAENLYHIKLYELGYSPYKLPEQGNYLEKFKEDPDIKKLFKVDGYFNLGF